MPAPTLIESPHNPHFRHWKALLESRGIKKQRRFLLSGRKTVPEALARYPQRFQALLVSAPEQAAQLPLPADLPVFQLSRPLFAELDAFGTGYPLLVGTLPELPVADLSQPPRGLELICALGDPDNLGALLRSAAAFGVGRVVLLAQAAHPYHPKALRAAANAQFELELAQGPDWSGLTGAAGPLLALDGRGESLADFHWPRDLRLVLGEEGRGLPGELPLRRLAIPTTGKVESLNATVAASLALFSWFGAR